MTGVGAGRHAAGQDYGSLLAEVRQAYKGGKQEQ
jgi:hypothetical protein